MYYIGLDVHKRTISYCVKDAAGCVAVARKMVAWMVAVERRKQDFVPAEERGGTVAA
jgi:hypothetical protein